MRTLKNKIETIYAKYHKPQYLDCDPLGWVHGFSDPKDQEIAGLLASALSYGRVACILSTLDKLKDTIKSHPFGFSMETSLKQKEAALAGITHRFTKGRDIALLLECVRKAVRKYETLGNLFRHVDPGGPHIGSALAEFVRTLQEPFRELNGAGLSYLLPSPVNGSACKRLNMYLRWMVRPKDGIDLGVWKGVSCARLLMPVDVHVARIGQKLGLTRMKAANWSMAVEITDSLKRFSPHDPVKYDFSLCKSGMLSTN